MADHTAEKRTLVRLPSGVEVTTTVHTYRGGSGPTVYVQAAQHGREVNGIEVLRRVHDRLLGAELAGTVVAVPVANPLTFDRVSYTAPPALDSVNANMNRVWPGDFEGSVHERMAASLWGLVEDADAVVDLHTGSPDMLTHVVVTEGHGPSRRLAEAFGTGLILSEPAGDDVLESFDDSSASRTGDRPEVADEEWEQRGFAGKLRVAAAREGLATITPELAHSRQVVEDAVEVGVTGLLNVLRELDVLAGTPEPNGRPTLARNHLGRVKAVDSGLFRVDPGRELGERVTEGTRLGTLYDPTTYEVIQEAEADRDGILYSLRREATVTAGGTLGGVAEIRE